MDRASTPTDRWFEVLFRNDRAQAASMVLDPGQSTGGPTNAHADSDQWLVVRTGRGVATVDGERVPLHAGDVVLIERGETHEIENDGDEPLETVSLYVPPEY
jgi:mannose-6-phosphate isomerase-like protein (cupin superfamily)